MSERPKELDWKSSIGVKAYQGFESLSLRHKEAPEGAFFVAERKRRGPLIRRVRSPEVTTRRVIFLIFVFLLYDISLISLNVFNLREKQ